MQRDLERKDGPGAKWGTGVWRATAGMVALWKDEARALRSGLEVADDLVKPALEKKLAVIEAKPWDALLTEGVAQAKDYAG